MKYSITCNYESESLEEDINKIANTFMAACERYYEITRKVKLESEVSETKDAVKGLDNRVDGIESQVKTLSNNFREVVTESLKKSSKKE